MDLTLLSLSIKVLEFGFSLSLSLSLSLRPILFMSMTDNADVIYIATCAAVDDAVVIQRCVCINSITVPLSNDLYRYEDQLQKYYKLPRKYDTFQQVQKI